MLALTKIGERSGQDTEADLEAARRLDGDVLEVRLLECRLHLARGERARAAARVAETLSSPDGELGAWFRIHALLDPRLAPLVQEAGG